MRAACPACGADELRPWRTAAASDTTLASRSSYLLERCATCGTAAVAGRDRGTERSELYERGTYASGPARLRLPVALLRAAVLRDRMRFLRDLPEGACVVEIGCGEGRFLEALAARGHRVLGFEPAAERAAAAQSRGLDVEPIAAEEAALPDATQDAVILWHVLEHLGDPAGTLRRVRGWLRPGGRLLVATPNLASLQARLGGEVWVHQDVPRHLTHFTEKGLAELLERTGLRVVRRSHLLVEHNVFGMWQSLLNRITSEPDAVLRFVKGVPRSTGRRAARRDATIVMLAGPLLLLPAAAAELAAGFGRRGGTIVLEARRG